MTEREHHEDTLIDLGSISEETLGMLTVGAQDIQDSGHFLNAGINPAD